MKARERQITAARTEELAARLAAYREENERLRAERNEAIQRTIELRAEVDALREELRLWQRGKRRPGDVTGESGDGTAAVADVADDHAAEAAAVDPLAELAIFVVGGSISWQRKAVERFPYMRFVGNEKNFDDAPLHAADVLVINTNAVSHAATEKAKAKRAAKGAVLVLTSTNNLDIVHKKIVQEVLS
ncbi:hypothetical protein [uncultured Selenomonas sp.]|uniref:hypothetical protein n=1 Tax=uncultured Selenomonas sp. TaxID=159275 RepID=UPI0025DA9F1C|nr:hypothetical protein [uncultured Selenomonas sp.]